MMWFFEWKNIISEYCKGGGKVVILQSKKEAYPAPPKGRELEDGLIDNE